MAFFFDNPHRMVGYLYAGLFEKICLLVPPDDVDLAGTSEVLEMTQINMSMPQKGDWQGRQAEVARPWVRGDRFLQDMMISKIWSVFSV